MIAGRPPEGNDEAETGSQETPGRGGGANVANNASGSSPARSLTTARDSLAEARARLQAAAVDDPVGDARRLLAAALDPATDAPTLSGLSWSAPLPEAARRRFQAMIDARAGRRPVSRILGRRAFFGHVFEISDAVLDPRPESESLVLAALAGASQLAPSGEPLRVLDLGVGSGCLLLSVLAAQPRAVGLGLDVSAAALAVAGRNAERLGLRRRARLVRGDWRAPSLPPPRRRFDLVLCNPPYISRREMARLAPEVRDGDPAIALSPGEDALEAYRILSERLGRWMAPGGGAFFEFGAGQGPSVRALFERTGWTRLRLRDDLSGRPRVLEARREGHGAAAPT